MDQSLLNGQIYCQVTTPIFDRIFSTVFENADFARQKMNDLITQLL